ncbi:MAG: hypothetical protein ABIF87_05755 [Pseudomonadota bacterium]
MPKKHLKKIELSDGIILDVWDVSRVVAGDRWFVRFEVSGDIPVKREYFDIVKDDEAAFEETQKVFGASIRYEYKRERIFIDKKVKDEVFQDLLTIFEESVLPYMSRSDFFKKFVVSKYIDLKRDPYKYQKASN